MAVVLGVDGGATKTKCVAFDWATQTPLGKGSSGCANWNGVGLDAAKNELLAAIHSCLADSGKAVADVAVVCIGMAGVDTPEDEAMLTDVVKGEVPDSVQVLVHNDAVTALASGTGGVLEGCVLVAGTGTVAVGVRDSGRTQARAGGWGPSFLDGGSGYDLGQRALTAISKCHDGRGAPTLLMEATLEHLQLQKPEELIRWVYSNRGFAHVASLAPLVIEAASLGDAVADTILRHGVGELFRSVKAVVSRLKLDELRDGFKLVLSGGLMQEGSLYVQYLVEVLKAEFPRVLVTFPRMEPAEGAALLAYQHLQQAAGGGST